MSQSVSVVNEAWLGQRSSTVRAVRTPAPDYSAEDRAFAQAFEGMTPHRQQALRLVAEGCSGEQVAERLFVSYQTVKNLMTVIYAQLGITCAHRAARAGYLLGRYDRRHEHDRVAE